MNRFGNLKDHINRMFFMLRQTGNFLCGRNQYQRKLRKLGILVIVHRMELADRTLESIYKMKLHEKISIWVMYCKEKSDAAPLIKKYKEKYRNTEYIDLAFIPIQMNYFYPKKFIRIFALRRMWGKHSYGVKPYVYAQARISQRGYQQALAHVNTRYLMVIPEGAELKSGFWEQSIEILDADKKIKTLISRIDYKSEKNRNRIDDKDADVRSGTGIKAMNEIRNGIEEETGNEIRNEAMNEIGNEAENEKNLTCSNMEYEKGDGISRFLKITNTEDVLLVFRREQLYPQEFYYYAPDMASDKYVIDHSVTLRMALGKSVITGRALAGYKLSDEEYKSRLSMRNQILRLAFLKGYVWHYNVDHGYKFDIQNIKGAYNRALNQYGDTVLHIVKETRKCGLTALSEQYEHLYQAVRQRELA